MSEYSETETTSSTGSGNAATLDIGQGKTTCSVGWDTSGAASVSVEVSHDKSTWFDRTHDVISSQPGSAEEKAETFQTGFEYVRVYIDQNVTELVVSAKGD